MPENKWDKYLEKGEQKSKWDKYVVEEDSKKKAQSDSIPVPNISDEVLATGFVSPSSVPSSATLSPLEIPRPQGQSEKVRVEAAKPKEEKPRRKDQLIIGEEAPASSKVKKMEELGMAVKPKGTNYDEAVDYTLELWNKKNPSASKQELKSKKEELYAGIREGKYSVSKSEKTGKGIVSRNEYQPNAGADAISYVTNAISKFGKQFYEGYKDVQQESWKSEEFANASPDEKVKIMDRQMAAMPDDEYLPTKKTESFGGKIASLIQPLEKPTIYATGAAATGGLMGMQGAAIGGLRSFGNTVGFMEDMINGGKTGNTKVVYQQLLDNYRKENGVEPEEQEKVAMMQQAEKSGNVGAALHGLNAIAMGGAFGAAQMRALEPQVNGFLNSLFQTAKHAAKTGNRLGLLSAGTSIASDIGANVYGAEISPQEMVQKAGESYVGQVEAAGMLEIAPKIIASIPAALTALTPNSRLAGSVKAQAKGLVSELPRNEIRIVYENAESAGIIPKGTTEKIMKSLEDFDNAKSVVPEGVKDSETLNALSGKLELKFKQEKEKEALLKERKKLTEKSGEAFKTRIAEIDEAVKKADENIKQLDKDIDNIYTTGDVWANEYDKETGVPYKELKPVEFEEQITTEEQFKEPLVETVEEESQVIPLQEKQKSQDITLQKEENEFKSSKENEKHNLLKKILEKAQIKNILNVSHKNNSHYWTIDGEYYRVADHTKPKGSFGEESYRGAIGKNDFRSYDEFYDFLKNKIDLSDKSELEKSYKDVAVNYIIKIDENTFKQPDGSLFSSMEAALNNMWRLKKELPNGYDIKIKPQEKVEPPVKVKEEVVSETPVSETKQAKPTKSIKDKFKDIADIQLSDEAPTLKKRKITEYLKQNPEIAETVKNFSKATEYLEKQGRLKKSSPDCP